MRLGVSRQCATLSSTSTYELSMNQTFTANRDFYDIALSCE